MGIILKDWYGKDHEYDYDRIWIRDTEGGLVPFTKGTGSATLKPLEVTKNGNYMPQTEGVDGFSEVTVEVPAKEVILQDKEAKENGEYTADNGYDGLGKVTVNVPAPEIELQEITITENGEYTPDVQYGGFSKVTVNIDSAGGDLADICYVTFMSYDGLVEYGKKAVALGDDCADPIMRGIFDTPTRESDAQYNYTHNGWANEPNGAAVSNWNKAIMEDKTVYASFEATLRNYTITYYDEDGITVLKTESKPYGSTPSYTPTKDGVTFDGWTPSLAVVEGDASYTAKWIEKITFAGSSWADIARIAESGKATEHFAIDDTREVPVTIGGTTYPFKAMIVGMNHDDLADGSGKAGLSIMFFTVPETLYKYHSSNFSSYLGYKDCDISKTVENFITNLPSDLQSVIKTVSKKYNEAGSTTIKSMDAKLWLPSWAEVGHYNSTYGLPLALGSKYAAFKSPKYGYAYSGSNHVVINTAGKTASGTLRDMNTQSGSYPCYSIQGTMASQTAANSASKNLSIGFCI